MMTRARHLAREFRIFHTLLTITLLTVATYLSAGAIFAPPVVVLGQPGSPPGSLSRCCERCRAKEGGYIY